MRPIRNRLAKLLFALAIAAMAAPLAIGQLRDAEAARRDQADVARLELRGPRIDGFDISSVDEPEADFQVRLARREAQLRATPDRLGGNRNVESATEVKTDTAVVGKTFVHGRTVREGTRARGLDLERYRFENVALEALLHGQGMSFDLSANKYDPDQIQNLLALVVTRVAEMNDTVGYAFWREVAGTADNVLVPHFVFKMTTGEGDRGPVPTSLSQDAAMALRDKISSSIRFRSRSPAKGAQPGTAAIGPARTSRAAGD